MVAIMCMKYLSTILVPCESKHAMQMIRMLEGMLVVSYRKKVSKKVAQVFLLPNLVILLATNFYCQIMDFFQHFFIHRTYIVCFLRQNLRRC